MIPIVVNSYLYVRSMYMYKYKYIQSYSTSTYVVTSNDILKPSHLEVLRTKDGSQKIVLA